MRAFIRTLGVEPDWVDDIAQDVFLTASKERNSFDTSRDLGKWLRGIARNHLRNEIRKQGRRRRILHEGLAAFLVEQSEVSCDTDDWKEVRLPAMRDCVESLPPRSRQIVSDSYAGGWKASEIAEQIGMSPAGVRQALVRIRRQLKNCIELNLSGGPSHDTI